MLFNSQILVRAFVLGASAVLIACGQKGPLYLPPAGSVQQPAPPQYQLPSPGNTQTTQQPAIPASAPQNK